MISFLCQKRENVGRYFNALVLQALKGKKAPHSDGWGLALYDKDDFSVKKSSKAIWKESPFFSLAKGGVLHARKTTSHRANVSFSHPFFFSFEGKDWSFVHNGAILNYENFNEIDTQFFLKKFVNNLTISSDVVEAMKKSVEEISSSYDYTSLNFFINNGEEMYAFKILPKDEDDYHSIFWFFDEHRAVFSTEPFDDGEWKEMKNGEFVHVKRVGGKLSLEKGRW